MQSSNWMRGFIGMVGTVVLVLLETIPATARVSIDLGVKFLLNALSFVSRLGT